MVRMSEKWNSMFNFYRFKVILVGEFGVGKTSILLRFTDNSFKEEQITTIGVDYVPKSTIVFDLTFR